MLKSGIVRYPRAHTEVDWSGALICAQLKCLVPAAAGCNSCAAPAHHSTCQQQQPQNVVHTCGISIAVTSPCSLKAAASSLRLRGSLCARLKPRTNRVLPSLWCSGAAQTRVHQRRHWCPWLSDVWCSRIQKQVLPLLWCPCDANAHFRERMQSSQCRASCAPRARLQANALHCKSSKRSMPAMRAQQPWNASGKHRRCCQGCKRAAPTLDGSITA